MYGDIATVMADSFTYFRGYVPSDVAAGIALMAMEQETQTVYHNASCVYRIRKNIISFIIIVELLFVDNKHYIMYNFTHYTYRLRTGKVIYTGSTENL